MRTIDIFERIISDFGGLKFLSLNMDGLALETEINDNDKLRLAEVEYKIAEYIKKSIDTESENILRKYKRNLVVEQITKGI